MAKLIGEQEVEDLAVGAAVLGSGGGGDTQLAKLLLLSAIRRNGPIQLLQLHELADEALVIPTLFMGAPTVLAEKIPHGKEPYQAVAALEQYLGQTSGATIAAQCAGMNAVMPFLAASHAGIPVVDGDGMGRAFTELQMVTFHIYGLSGSPMVICNERGDRSIIEALDNVRMERLARAMTVRMGGVGYVAMYPMTGKQVKETATPYTVSLAMRIGTAIRAARSMRQSPIDAIIDTTANSNYGPAIPLFRGKIREVHRTSAGGFPYGRCLIEGYGDCTGRLLEIEFQNENLVARDDGRVVAMVPDLITLLDLETATPLTTEDLKYGYRVVCLAIPTPEIMRTPAALAVWGPRYFGLDLDFTPLELLHPEYYAKAMV